MKTKPRTTRTPLAAALCAAAILASGARAGEWTANRDTAWDYGTAPGSVNTIATPAQLAQFAWVINNVTNLIGTTNIITATLDLSTHHWTPAGLSPAAQRFSGTLTAAPGALIDGLAITNGAIGYIGFFGYTAAAACVDGIILTNTAINITGNGSDLHVGGIAGSNNGTITNCSNHGTVTASDDTGNGYYLYIGGIAGQNVNSRAKIVDCVNRAEVNGRFYNIVNAGGIAGELYSVGAVITRCANHASVTATSTATGSAGVNAGGIVSAASSGAVANCANHGTVTASALGNFASARAGGIVSLTQNTVVIANCVNHGTVYGSAPGNYYSVGGTFYSYGGVGGIVGDSSSGQIVNCVNHGPVTAADSTTNTLGAIAGYSSSYATIANCYWNTSVPANASLPAVADGSVTGCDTFGAAPGTLSTGSLIDALNGWLDNSRIAVRSVNYFYWTLDGSTDGYPRLSGDALPPLPVTVTFNGNGGQPGTQSIVQAFDRPYVLPSSDPTHTGHTFAGWFTGASGGSRVTDLTIVLNGAAHTVYARWTQDAPPPVTSIAPGGNTAGIAGLPLIILPGGGSHDPSTGILTDSAGATVYAPGQGGIAITTITPGADGPVTLTLAAPGAALFGKAALEDTAWTYLNQHPGATYSRLGTTAEIAAAAGFRFFTAR